MHSTMSNISIGIAERICDTLITGYFFFIYQYLHKHYAIFSISNNIYTWIFLLFLTDFIWYWYHRLAHEWNIFWSVHIVHHQSEDFNYTVSARITVLQALVRTSFWAFIPILGFPAEMISTMLLLHGLYPFFIHTSLVKDLGIFEYFLVTPSHHSVHHASNPEYLDKNYGDVFIIWDKIFGTFKKIDPAIQIKYGLTSPLRSYSFLWQHFHFFIELSIAIRNTNGFINKIKLLFKKPDSIPYKCRIEANQTFGIVPVKAHIPSNINRYVAGQLLFLLVLLFLFILLEKYVTTFFCFAILLIVLLTLINCCAILERKRWIFYLEISRLIVMISSIFYYFDIPIFPICLSISLLLTIFNLNELKRRYLQLVYNL